MHSHPVLKIADVPSADVCGTLPTVRFDLGTGPWVDTVQIGLHSVH
jgi:hypothetical protein